MSSSPQAERESLDDQERLNAEFVASLSSHYPGYAGVIVETLKIVGSRSIIELSEACKRHKAYAHLVAAIKARQFDALICRSRDRIARTDALILTIERLCQEYDILVVPRQSLPVTLDIRAVRASEGAGLISAIEGHFAAAGVRRLVHDNKMGMEARVRALRLFPSNLPWGYRYIFSETGEQSIAVEPGAAYVLRAILIEKFIDARLSYGQIAAALNAAGEPAPSGGQWSKRSVLNIIANAERYAGYLTLNKRSKTGRDVIHVLGRHDAILSETELAKVRLERDSRRYGRLPDGSLFSGVVYCTMSGQPLVSQTRRHSGPNGVATYRRMRCLHCSTQHSISEKDLIACVSDFLRKLQGVTDPSKLLSSHTPENRAAIENNIAALITRLNDIEKQKSKLLALYLERDDISTKMFDEEMAALTRQEELAQGGIATQRERLKSSVAAEQELARIVRLQQMADRVSELLRTNPLAAQRFLFQSIRIHVNPLTGKRGIADIIIL